MEIVPVSRAKSAIFDVGFELIASKLSNLKSLAYPVLRWQ